MDWTAALEIVIARTRHERWRALCAEDHPDHLIHRARVVAMATGRPPEPAVLAAQASRPELLAALETQRKIGACPYRSTVGCGCAGARCGLKIDPLGPVTTPRRWAIVSHRDCAACIEHYGA